MTHYLTSSHFSARLLPQLLSTVSSNNLQSNTFSMLQQTLRTKVHLLQAPRITRLFHCSQIHRSQIRTFRSSTRKLPLAALIAKALTTLGLNTNEFTDVFATKIDKLKADVDGLKGDVSTLKQDVSALKTDIKEPEHSMKEQSVRRVFNQEKPFSQITLSLKEQLSQLTLQEEKLFSQLTLNLEKHLSRLYWHGLFGVSLTPYIICRFLTRLRAWELQYCLSVVHGSYR